MKAQCDFGIEGKGGSLVVELCAEGGLVAAPPCDR
jgi:hypothetical protein